LGYQLKYKLLNAADYGVPQIRERVIIIGIKDINNFEFSNIKLPHLSLSDALSDLPSIKSGESSTTYKSKPLNEYQKYIRNGTNTLTEHKASTHNKELQLIMDTLKDGEDKYSLPEEIRPQKGFGNTYAKLWWDKPSVTITRNFACPSSSRCIHPRDSRALTIREGARLQSFPDTYLFYGSDTMKRLEIGNAVPPLLSKSLAIQLLNYLNKNP
jgi:DNA (cytosine-5)-methyltransferase 1